MVEANVVRELIVGNTRIKIADDFCVSAERAEQILKDMATQIQRQLIAEVSQQPK